MGVEGGGGKTETDRKEPKHVPFKVELQQLILPPRRREWRVAILHP